MCFEIKSLEWEKFSNQHGTQYRAQGIFGWLHYISNRDEGGHLFDGWRSTLGTFDTIDAAKAAAQSAYDARIRSAIERKAEPVAWKEFLDGLETWCCELPDRTSPEDAPEMMLIDRDELHMIAEKVRDFLPTPPAEPVTGEQAIRAHAHLIRCFADDINERNWDDKRLYIMRQIDRLVGELDSPSPVDSRDLIERAAVADQIIGQIEDRFPNWRSYRDLIDCIDCTLAELRKGAAQ